MEGVKKVCFDNVEEFWFGKEEFGGTYLGGGLLFYLGNRGGEW